MRSIIKFNHLKNKKIKNLSLVQTVMIIPLLHLQEVVVDQAVHQVKKAPFKNN